MLARARKDYAETFVHYPAKGCRKGKDTLMSVPTNRALTKKLTSEFDRALAKSSMVSQADDESRLRKVAYGMFGNGWIGLNTVHAIEDTISNGDRYDAVVWIRDIQKTNGVAFNY